MGSSKEMLEDMDMRADRVVLDRLEWSGVPGGRFMSGNASGKAGRSGAIQMCLRRHRRLSLLAPRFISRRWPGLMCVRSFHVYLTCRFSYLV